MKTTTCLKCKREITNSAFERHFKSHTLYDLEVLQREYDSGLSLDKVSAKCKVSRIWLQNNLIMRSKSDAVKNARDLYKEVFAWDDERREKHSKIMSDVVANNPKSYSHLRGGKRKYKDYLVDSTWEIFAIQYFENNNIRFERDVEYFKYTFLDKIRKYFPDFYLPDYDVYIEVKGYKTDKDVAKWSQFDKTLIIIDKSNIEKIRLNQLTIEDLIGVLR